MASSSFNGKWRLYGTENSHLFAESFQLPAHIASTLVHLRPREEVHVNGDSVHVRLEIPPFEIPGCTVEKNATFNQQCTVPLISTGSNASGTLKKVSDTLWVANLTSPDAGPITVTREIIGGEMWVSIEARGAKMIHKYERTRAVPCPITGRYPYMYPASESSYMSICPDSKSMSGYSYSTSCPCPTGSSSCPCPASCPCKSSSSCPKSTMSSATLSPFAGSWSMYGTEGSDQFYAAANVPEMIRRLMTNVRIFETIHVNGENVHVRICVSPVHVPARVHELRFSFGQQYDYTCPYTGSLAKGTATKMSDTKWTGKVTGLKSGDLTLTRELVNGEMWLTFANAKGPVVRKFERYEGREYDEAGMRL